MRKTQDRKLVQKDKDKNKTLTSVSCSLATRQALFREPHFHLWCPTHTVIVTCTTEISAGGWYPSSLLPIQVTLT